MTIKGAMLVIENIAQLVALYMGADPYKVVGIQTHTVNVEPLLDKLGIDYNPEEDTLHVRQE